MTQKLISPLFIFTSREVTLYRSTTQSTATHQMVRLQSTTGLNVQSFQELGEGTHSFTGYIYSGVTGDPAKMTGTRAKKTVTLSESDVIFG